MSKDRVTQHQTGTGEINDKIKLTALETGKGGAAHRYLFELDGSEGGIIAFQNGCLGEPGVTVNGLTNEALLAIVAHRLGGFQAGPYACHENGVAKYHIETALEWLKKRTYVRKSQGVEGTYVNHKQDEEKMKSRVRVDDEWVHIGDRKIAKDSLATQWKAWSNAESAAKALKPKLTDFELNQLSEVPTNVSASNGFNEFKQAVGQSG